MTAKQNPLDEKNIKFLPKSKETFVASSNALRCKPPSQNSAVHLYNTTFSV